jgi:conjugal transfer/entry exclusion protein
MLRIAFVVLSLSIAGCLQASAAGGQIEHLIVRYKDSERAAIAANPDAAARELARQITTAAGMPVRHVRMLNATMALVALPRKMSEKDAKVVADRIAKHPKVEYAEPDAQMKTQ